MQRLARTLAAAAALSLAVAAPAAAAPVVQEYDWDQFEWFNNGLGGIPYVWTQGGYWRQTFAPGLPAIGSLGLDLEFYRLSDVPHLYDVLVNGVVVGSFGLPGNPVPGPADDVSFVGGFAFAPIAGPLYVVELRQTTPTPAVPSGSFALNTFNSPDGYTGGHSYVSFDVTAVPEPTTLVLVVGGLAALVPVARRRRG